MADEKMKKTDDALEGQMSPEAVNAELQLLKLEEQRLNLIVLRETVEKIRTQQYMMLEAVKRQVATILQEKLRKEGDQKLCAHKKGGRGRENILNGNAAEYAIIVQTEPWGETYCMCMRCNKEWRRPLAVLRLVNPSAFIQAKKKDLRSYKQALLAFETAIRMTTDNTPSGSTLFTFTREESEDAA